MHQDGPVEGASHCLSHASNTLSNSFGRLKFTPEDDERLANLIRQHGSKDWFVIAMIMGNRNARQCRDRYNNYLNPGLHHGEWTHEEDELLRAKHKEYGAKWHKISAFFVNRSDIGLRNRWLILARHKAREERDISFSSATSDVHKRELVLPLILAGNSLRPDETAIPEPSFDDTDLFEYHWSEVPLYSYL
jgi:hypothetical protein